MKHIHIVFPCLDVGCPNNSEHCGPEVAVVGRTLAFAREAERLARETAGEHVDAVAPNGKVCCSYVFINVPIRENDTSIRAGRTGRSRS